MLKGALVRDFRPSVIYSKSRVPAWSPDSYPSNRKIKEKTINKVIQFMGFFSSLLSNSWSYLNWSLTECCIMNWGVRSFRCMMQRGVKSYCCIVRRESNRTTVSCSGESNLTVALWRGSQIVPLHHAAGNKILLLHCAGGVKSHHCVMQRGVKSYCCIVQVE
jgi:hypothetical protein